jgi:hypothetical protein
MLWRAGQRIADIANAAGRVQLCAMQITVLLFGYAKRGGWWPPPGRASFA